MMTRVFGQLFDDNRNGFLAVKPSKPFFGCDRYEQKYPVQDGWIDIELLPTPRGVEYLVGFKKAGDYRRVDYTLRWRVQDVAEIDVTPKAEQKPAHSSSKIPSDLVQVKRLATELALSMENVTRLEEDLRQANEQLAVLSSKFDEHKTSTERVLYERDQLIHQFENSSEPEVVTVVKQVAVPPERLEARIKFLESELFRTQELNSQYYLSVLELHQLKLERAQSLPSPGPVVSPADTPHQRLINKLIAK